MAYKGNKYHSKTAEQKIVEGFFKGLWWLISLPWRLIFGKSIPNRQSNNSTAQVIDRQFIVAKWGEIEELIRLGKPSNFTKAILEADKLIDHILKDLRTPGLTMGDRLKASKNRFSPEAYDALWRAHKVRNEIVHEANYQITDFIAREAIANFKKALEELVK